MELQTSTTEDVMIEILGYIDIAGFIVLATIAYWFAQDWGGWAAGWWAGALLVMTCAVALTPALAGTDPTSREWLTRAVLCLLLLFPYLTLRLALSLVSESARGLPVRAEIALAGLTAAMVASALFVPSVPTPGATFTDGPSIYLALVTGYALCLSAFAAAWLWRHPVRAASSGQRVRLALALLGLTLAVWFLHSPGLPVRLAAVPVIGLVFACVTHAELRRITKSGAVADHA